MKREPKMRTSTKHNDLTTYKLRLITCKARQIITSRAKRTKAYAPAPHDDGEGLRETALYLAR